jgi:hypothetical protein
MMPTAGFTPRSGPDGKESFVPKDELVPAEDGNDTPSGEDDEPLSAGDAAALDTNSNAGNATADGQQQKTGGSTKAESNQDPKPKWPKPLTFAAQPGIVGEFVDMLLPHAEADTAALVFQFLAAAGNVIGDGPFYLVEDDRHPARLNVVLVGRTAKGRKETTLGRVRSPHRGAAERQPVDDAIEQAGITTCTKTAQ